MFSLVNTLMFEQEAPRWHICELCSPGTYVWVVMCNKLSFVPVIFFLKTRTCERWILFKPKFQTGYWELQSFVGDIFPLDRILNRNLHFQPEIFWRPLNSNLREVNYFLNRKFLNWIWELQSFVGEQISLEPDFKPVFFILNQKFSDGL